MVVSSENTNAKEASVPPYLKIVLFPLGPQVDFDAPLGYKEPERQVQHEESTVSRLSGIPPQPWRCLPTSVMGLLWEGIPRVLWQQTRRDWPLLMLTRPCALLLEDSMSQLLGVQG